MAVEALRPSSPALASRRDEAFAGLIAALITLPVCLASGVLAFAPMGSEYAAKGAAAGLIAAIVAGSLSALIATSSCAITSPRVGIALVQASLVTALLASPAVAGDHDLVVMALALCVLLAGLWQLLFGIFGIAKVIKFTPHPVLAGFINGVALLIILSQLKPFFRTDGVQAGLLSWLNRPSMFLFVLALTAFMLSFPMISGKLLGPVLSKRISGTLAGFIVGIVLFYIVTFLAPGLELGPRLGALGFTLAPALTVQGVTAIFPLAWEIAIGSLVLAIVASIDGLLSLRSAQNLADFEVHPRQDLTAQGVGNVAAALVGGVASTVSLPQTMAAFRAGGRTRITALTAASLLIVLGGLFSDTLSVIPTAVLSAILLTTGIMLFDSWSFGLIATLLRSESALIRGRALYDLAVVVAVMGVTVLHSVIAGVLVGCLLSGIIFIVNMSRPVIRRSFLGHQISSKRIRPSDDLKILQKTGPQRVALELEGVLFFGNADDLSRHVRQLFDQVDMIVLDFKAVSDIDVSGANVLCNLLDKSRELHKHLIFCNVPSSQETILKNVLAEGRLAETQIARDLDSALEWMEEQSLCKDAGRRGGSQLLALDEIDFLKGLQPEQLAELSKVFTLREYKPGDILCHEGDDGDRMWLLLKGSVSVRLTVADDRGTRRIAGLGRGTTVGEMSLIERAPRSATIVADEGVVCYELARDGFDIILKDHPAIATRILRNLAHELARRLRQTSEDLRHMRS